MRRRLLVNINLYGDLVYGNANYQFLDQPEELALPNQSLMSLDLGDEANAAGIVRRCLAQAASEIPLNVCDIPIIPSGRASSAAGRRVGPGCTAIV